MLNVTNLSTLNIAVSTPTVIACHLSPPSLPQLPVPQQPNLLLGHFRRNSPFLPFLPAPDTKLT